MGKKFASYIWAEYYRPKYVKDIILPANYKRQFTKFINEKQIPNMLLHASSPGVGKTTLAKALARDLDANMLYINASKDGGIDTLRSLIQKFASTKSFNGKPKIVLLDEADGTTSTMQQGLRGFMDDFNKVCRFVLTCNYITKIIEPIQDRCICYDMNFSKKKVKEEMIPKIEKRIELILKDKDVEYKIETISKLIKTHYPSIRKVIQSCQHYSSMNGMIDDEIFNMEEIDTEFYHYVLDKEFGKARKYMLDASYNYDEIYTKMYREYVPMLEPNDQANAILIIAEYMYRNSTVIDKEINFSAMLLELMGC